MAKRSVEGYFERILYILLQVVTKCNHIRTAAIRRSSKSDEKFCPAVGVPFQNILKKDVDVFLENVSIRLFHRTVI